MADLTIQPNYEQALTELESIVADIENDRIPIYQLSAVVRRAGELIQLCRDRLRATEEEVKKVLEE
jgi:exodeoxyribonuclease VII small subunit